MRKDQDIPYGCVRIKCKDCQQSYFLKAKILKKKVQENNGWFPCEKCGSHATTWEFRTDL